MARAIGFRGGAVDFRTYMELALYDPHYGYYARGGPRTGRGGDFLTAPTASHWYTTVLGGLLARLSGRVGRLTLVDVAAGDGAFLAGVLKRLGQHRGDCLRAAIAVERSPARRVDLERLFAGQAVLVAEDLEHVARAAGPVVIHASELYDAAPVHRVVGRNGALAELWVRSDGDRLEWEERSAPSVLADYLARHGVTLAEGQLAEVDLTARADHAARLGWAGPMGAAVVLDYGYPARRLYDPRGRSTGSLACYRTHHMTRDPLVDPGELDLTTHVNWDDLRRAGSDAGWHEVGLWPLAELMVRADLAGEVERLGLGESADLDARTVTERQELKRLLDPEGMGSDLKALVQAGPGLADLVTELLER